ncbi:putative endogenous retrovirus group FC1 Env polyprotein [Meriones unguiculatus]|uniref:putative endogenous retrovirus group FC1 Env polyprotein n=1 Tax=Meriones unguiculatus TaxID=10047 RepID=UPI000B4F4EBB|nr:putative endogenous retrovirus group FC1 Env polyprotein [Meriones unguiculatus]XP_060227420.1 putative endogenous retrovirus group FC1 Env polyprotein [Meriones unguiculatus]XP_060227421.1 putative endogenous retrovirus group FC1 Env polyprotein [Meriones unguiculatus]
MGFNLMMLFCLAVFPSVLSLNLNRIPQAPKPTKPTPMAWKFHVIALENCNKTIASTFCPVTGCASTISLTFDIRDTCKGKCINDLYNAMTSPIYVCFLYEQTRSECKDPNYGGCPYWSCKYHSTWPSWGGENPSRLNSVDWHTRVTYSIPDPWNDRWRTGVEGYVYRHNERDTAYDGKTKIFIFRKLAKFIQPNSLI